MARGQGVEPAGPLAKVLTAAGKRVDLSSRRDVAMVKRREKWQDDAWLFYDAIPEVKFAVWWVANVLAKVRLFVGVVVDPEEDPVPVDDPDSGVPAAVAARAVAELARLRSEDGGQSEIISRLAMNLDVAGDVNIVGWGAREPELDQTTGNMTEPRPERWEVRSVSEVEGAPGNDGVRVKDDPGDQGEPLVKGRDTIMRIWNKHPRWSTKADSLLGSVLADCVLLEAIEKQMLAEHRSRHMAGAITIPNELTLGPRLPTTSEVGQQGMVDALVESIYEAMAAAVEDPDAPESYAPFALTGPAQYLTPEYVRRVDLSRQSGAELDQRHERVVRRVARGIYLPPEIVMGHQETTFANAAQVDRNTWKDYLHPRMVLLVNGVTFAFLRPQLRDTANGATPVPPELLERIVVWFDPSPVLPPPDLAASADEAYDRGEITGDTYRRVKGYDEADRPEPVEVLIRAGLRRGILTADLTKALLDLLGVPIEVEPLPLPEPVDDGTTDDTTDEAVAAAATMLRLAATPGVTSRRSSTVGRRLMELDRELRTRLLTLADATLHRALERAGSRLRSKASGHRAVLTAVPAHLVAARMGRDAVTAAGLDDEALLEGAFDGMRDQFMRWGARAQADALDLVARVVGGFTRVERDALGLRQAGSLDEAWEWLEGALRNLAARRLFDPEADNLDDLGEVLEGVDVPPGMIRHAVARAGGAVGLETQGSDAWVTVGQAGTRPAGGIGTGDLVLEVLGDHDVDVDGYVWSYGPGLRRTPFEPHQDLDGVEFANFDDAVLSNFTGWPEFGFYMPGDHAGCMCDVELLGLDGPSTVVEDMEV